MSAYLDRTARQGSRSRQSDVGSKHLADGDELHELRQRFIGCFSAESYMYCQELRIVHNKSVSTAVCTRLVRQKNWQDIFAS